MDRKLIQTLGIATAIVAVAAALSACGGSKAQRPTESTGDILSANIALLDQNEVPDYELHTADSLLRFEATVTDLGRMKVGQKRDAVFKFANVSTAPIVITRIVTTCGCTSAEYEKKPLMPDKKSEIRVGFEAEEEGVFFKKLFIYYAGGDSPLEIAIKGEVK